MNKLMEGIIIILGHTNTTEGILSPIAESRLQQGIEIAKQHPNFNLICTGGFGDHFNTTSHPHAFYSQNYLLRYGIDPAQILPPILSKNTLEDASLIKPVLEKNQPQEIIIVTSDFHMPRVKKVFGYFHPTSSFTFITAVSLISETDMQQLLKHEQEAISRFETNYSNS